MKSILDPTFEYTPSYATDIRKTFRRVMPTAPAPQNPPTPTEYYGHPPAYAMCPSAHVLQ